MIDDVNEYNEAGNYRINNNKTTTSKSFAWKIKILGSTPADDKTWDTEFVVSLKNLSNFWRFLDLPLINYEIELDLSWSNDCIIPEISRTPEAPANPAADHVLPTKKTGATFQVNSIKLYVLVVTLSVNDKIKLL